MNVDVVVAVMAGGAGTRFWPASTHARPKQFLQLTGERTLLQQSFDRARGLAPLERILVVSNAAFAPLVSAQLPELPKDNVVNEPARRDTAASVVLATLLAHKRFPGAVLVVLTSDHVIAPADAFAKTVRSAVENCGDSLYTIGIPPTHPATGYGYLELGARMRDDTGVQHREVVRFVEKPDLETAKKYLASGDFLWNSGMFVWKPETALAVMREHLPKHVENIGGAVGYDRSTAFEAALTSAFADLPKISVDYGLMEKAVGRVSCVPAMFSWSDVGSFPTLADHLPKERGNAHRGRVAALDARDNVVWCDDAGELVALIGVNDLVVVRAGKRTLVVPKARAEEIKKLVDSLPPEDKE